MYCEWIYSNSRSYCPLVHSNWWLCDLTRGGHSNVVHLCLYVVVGLLSEVPHCGLRIFFPAQFPYGWLPYCLMLLLCPLKGHNAITCYSQLCKTNSGDQYHDDVRLRLFAGKWIPFGKWIPGKVNSWKVNSGKVFSDVW